MLFHASLGVRLDEVEAKAFALVRREGEAKLAQLKAVTGLPTRGAAEVAERLATQKLIDPVGTGGRYALAEHLREYLGGTEHTDPQKRNLAPAQVDNGRAHLATATVEMLSELSETQWKIVEYCDVPRQLTELLVVLDVANRGYFRKHHLNPLIRAGIIATMNPSKPHAPNQRYVITDAGAALKARRAGGR